ncbi:hypothetical protein AWJ20_5056 [Sugiyamaella lignohabitans]|uniref:Uncharacterized protein n=1 Tax=Sugiyamaella lignohabitans TaxID=796027 RepID=A0A167EHS3_9ASCO|nr:uncharacterized protein AWJ20_5056 [Sugiyamaella lignohabitans]ANB14099.1 hypothetical protein AWJ20_5056 [Sugiyamaella lignohabitans]
MFRPLINIRPLTSGLRQPLVLGRTSAQSLIIYRSAVSRAAKKVVKQDPTIDKWEHAPRTGDGAAVATSLKSSGNSSEESEKSNSLTDEERLKLMESHPAVRKFPRFMRKYAVRFVNAPVSHVTSFLIIHEITAIAPLFALWSLFHHYDFVPPGLPDWLVSNGVNFIKVLAERNNWDTIVTAANTSKIIIQGAAAYAMVKVLLPLRIALSLFLMPWFARVFVLPVTNRLSKLWPKKKKQSGPKSDEAQDLSQDLTKDIKKKDVQNDSNRPSL